MIEHLSYSSISSYLLCPAAWRFHYIERIETPMSVALFFGATFHDTIEDYIRVNARGIPKELLSIWSEKWRKNLVGETVEWGVESPEEHYNQGVTMLSNEKVIHALKSIKPRLEGGKKPIIEKRVELKVPSVEVPIIGFIDIITEDGVPGDFKTSSRRWGQSKAEDELQPLFYLAALNQAGVRSNGTFRHYIFTKGKSPDIQILEHQHKLTEMMFLFRMIENVWKAIQAEVFPENPTGWKCNARYCEYWHLCRGRYR